MINLTLVWICILTSLWYFLDIDLIKIDILENLQFNSEILILIFFLILLLCLTIKLIFSNIKNKSKQTLVDKIEYYFYLFLSFLTPYLIATKLQIIPSYYNIIKVIILSVFIWKILWFLFVSIKVLINKKIKYSLRNTIFSSLIFSIFIVILVLTYFILENNIILTIIFILSLIIFFVYEIIYDKLNKITETNTNFMNYKFRFDGFEKELLKLPWDHLSNNKFNKFLLKKLVKEILCEIKNFKISTNTEMKFLKGKWIEFYWNMYDDYKILTIIIDKSINFEITYKYIKVALGLKLVDFDDINFTIHELWLFSFLLYLKEVFKIDINNIIQKNSKAIKPDLYKKLLMLLK